MAYKRPLVISNGLIEELQASDLLDQSAVIVGPGLTGLTAGQVPYANSTTTVACSANLTFNGTTLTAAALATGYTQTTGGTANTLSGVCVPLSSTAASNFMLLDCNDSFAFVDQIGTVTVSPPPGTPASGSVALLFRRDANSLGPGQTPIWSLSGTTSVQFVVTPTGIANSGNFNLVLQFVNGYSLPTNIQVEVYNNISAGYTTEYNSAVSISGLVWVSPALSGAGNLSTVGNIRITLTIPDPALGTSFSLSRMILNNPSQVFDPWCVSRSGSYGMYPFGNIYGSVALVGSGSNLAVGGTLNVTGASTLGSLSLTGSMTLASGWPVTGLINSSVTFYVATTGSDTTGTGTSGNPWASVAKALSVLASYTIAPNATVTISVAAGNYTALSAITINHPQSPQIIITGPTPNTTTVTGVTSFGAPSSGKSTVVITVASAANIANGDYLVIAGITGTLSGTCAHYWNLCGCHKVTNVSGTAITITITVNTNTANATTSSGTTTGLTIPVTILTTTMAFTANGLVVSSQAANTTLGYLSNLVLIGPSSSSGTGLAGGNVTCLNVGFVTWLTGVGGTTSTTILCTTCAASGCGVGFNVNFGSVLALSGCVANGCTSYGLYSQYSTTISAPNAALVGNSAAGAILLFSCSLTANASFFCDNTCAANTGGLSLFFNSTANFSSNCNLSYNSTYGLYTSDVSICVNAGSCTYTSNTTAAASPAVATATAGNNESFNFTSQ